MALYVSTTGSNVVINELGITITHPTTDLELVAQFGTERITLADSLTTAIQSGSLTWKRTLVGGTQTPASYLPISPESEELTAELATDAELASGLAGKQPLDATLTSLAAFNSNGLLTQTAPDTFAARTITGTASNISVTNGDGVSGNPTLDLVSTGVTANTYGSASSVSVVTVDVKGRITNAVTTAISIVSSAVTNFAATVLSTVLTGYTVGANTALAATDTVLGAFQKIQGQLDNKQPLDATLTALAAFNTNGVLVQTAADTFTGRTITGTASNISVTNGNGVSGNPVLDLIDTGATAGSYGSAVNIPIITVDAKGRITSITFATLNPATTTATGTNNITTTSTTDVLMTNLQIVNPPAGTYQVLGSTVLQHNTNNASVFMSIYAGGTKVTASEQFAVPVFQQGLTPSITIPSGVTVLAEVTVNGSQNIEVRWRTTSGTANCTNRTLNIQRIR